MENTTSLVTEINDFLGMIAGYVWNLPLVILLVGTGLILTFLLGLIQIKGFLHSFRVLKGDFDNRSDPGEISHFQALCTALSATVGLGNIAGVAVAIHVGGPGATFWMILTGLVGMATKYAECTLSIRYRHIDERGVVNGGPMYYIKEGLGRVKNLAFLSKPLSYFFAFACMWGALGAGNMFQTNQVASILKTNFEIPTWVTGLSLAFFTAIVIIGGIKRIGFVTGRLVPIMGGIYVTGCLVTIGANIGQVPELLGLIIQSAFSQTAVGGGFLGIAVQTALIQGVRRACFSNEAGLGSAPIAHSAAKTKEPVREGVVALLEPFVDTVVICTMTALVILISGVPFWEYNGIELTARAFNASIPGFGTYFVPLAVLLFAYSTLLSWSYYGEKAVVFLFDQGAVLAYKILFCGLAIVGALWKIGPVLNFSDIMLGLMAIPNLIAILLLLPQVRSLTKDYFKRLQDGEFESKKV